METRIVDTWAEFREWHYSVDKQHVPHYEIKGSHKLSGVIVDANSLLRFGIAIPPTPECKDENADVSN